MHAKTISHFLPLAARPPEESDRHYREVHTPFARRVLRELPHLLSYTTDRVVAERDLAGGWAQRPRAFRYVALRYAEGHTLELPAEVRPRIVEDHRSCLRELRSFAVREQVLVDRHTGQTGLQKHVVELDRRDGVPAEEGARYLDKQLAVLAVEAGGAFGLRRVLVDHVLTEGATEPIDEPGQRPLGRPLPDTPRQAFLELWFDHPDWADEWLAVPAVREVLEDPWWAAVRTYRVHEECGMDRR